MHIHPHTDTSWLKWPFFENLLVAVVGGLPVLFVWAFIGIMMDEKQGSITVFRNTKEILTGVSASCGDPCGELRFPAKGLCNIMGKRSWIDFSFASVMQQQNKLRCFHRFSQLKVPALFHDIVYSFVLSLERDPW
ncbi:hypothetical protein MCOR07_001653 [Pyricularia oryzae]|uniref:Uncharacterized protein n=1 Tax=Pyricularia grisea TaxID=148305 RepID=A0ABQ8N8S9_PYRGI|nr:hypothetical protein MCOR33_009374 [Pyricularia grisea]KAI6320992.1 hypothetical protein MCOR29_005124 [Pyricularia oryzae]KAI6355292.1 hypothetical protein MCOR32_010309 [Pyricularia oryzae]KAI6364098.1 hypothetical protein MCOR31_007582 [Pyricularia oryzae]KAI6421170.1 hypothetical protein MCOR24_004399 [Pyricularia oryzae]